jgi:hypothetical protein
MQITEIQIELIKPNNGLIGFASLVVDGNIYLSSIAIHKKLNSSGLCQQILCLTFFINLITPQTFQKTSD